MTRVRGTRFCPSCSRLVIPTKRFVIRAFLAWLVFGVGVGGVAYLVWYAVKPRVRCSLCRAPTLKRVPKGYALNPNGHGFFSPRGDAATSRAAPPRARPRDASPRATAPRSSGPHVPAEPGGTVPVATPAVATLPVDTRPVERIPVTPTPPAVPEVTASRCPACAYPVVEGVKKPIHVTCPECGAEGHLIRKK